ncbi:hypothetical protein FGB62_202g03 [Gracilaria domingensis]|nr:hypothetical protein FGB62_202g03 [Gracilaria domingensis]
MSFNPISFGTVTVCWGDETPFTAKGNGWQSDEMLVKKEYEPLEILRSGPLEQDCEDQMGITTSYCGAEFFWKPGNAPSSRTETFQDIWLPNGTSQWAFSGLTCLVWKPWYCEVIRHRILCATNGKLECNETLRSSVPVMKTNGERDGQMVNYLPYQHAAEYCDVDDRCRSLDMQWMYGTQMVFLNHWLSM